ncbi:MAG: DNA polymerase III subunit alpha [Bacteroidota bacterium]
MSDFVHLHNHTHYSLLDGACTVEDLINAAVEQKMPAVALTDHGVLFGAIEFYQKAKKANIKPIIGSEVYIVTKGSRFDKVTPAEARANGGKRGIYHHLVLLAKNQTGYKNLVKLSTIGHIEGFYYKPRIDLDTLRQYSEGLIGLSACSGGVVATHLVDGRYDLAREAAVLYKEILGKDFYLEIQDHGLEREKTILANMPKLAQELEIKLIATNDCHYIKHEHAIAHNILLMIPEASSTNIQDYTQLRYGTDQIYFKSSAEMTALFYQYPQALESTLEVAEKCNVELDLHTNHMPEFPIPPDAGVATLNDYLRKLAHEGIGRRYPNMTQEISERLEHELTVITRMNYAGYFLIVHDFISKAREMGVYVGPGRGSAAGSIVSYALGITNVDPLKYDLLFERFLNPDRISMPDIDVDFSDAKRGMVIDYVRQKYGIDSVSQIITFGSLATRAVLKDVGRVLGVPLSTIDSITKQIPVIQGKVKPLAEALKDVPDLKWVKESKDPKIQQLIEVSLVLEGMNRNASTHAAGVVIAPGPISDYVPLYKTPQTDSMTQYAMKDLEEAGLLKMDFLGLRTLTVIENTLRLIKQRHGIDIELDSIPIDDAATFELFAKGQTVAVFQFESSGMQDSLRKLRPTKITDLVAMNALYRPGPMSMIDDFIARKHGTQIIGYLHPKLESILHETYGIIVYQEQVMKITSEIAGFTLARADMMRRAMGKKDKALMARLKKEFVDGAAGNHIDKKVASDIFDLIEKFASYGFNKSHSVAYSIIAYQTAFLKAHYPAEFMAATLSSEIGNTDKIVLFIDDCRSLGIEVLPPDVNESEADFIVSKSGIRFGLGAIKNVGSGAVDTIVQVRNIAGKFSSLYDFCSKVDLRVVNKKMIESLIQAGAFDSIPGHRAQLLESVDSATAYGQNFQEEARRHQSNLFEAGKSSHHGVFGTPSLPAVEPWTEMEKLRREKALLGFYVSGHPLNRFKDVVESFATARLGDGESIKDGSTVRVCGIVTSVKKKIDKRGNTMAFITIEDFSGKGECVVFSDAYRRHEQTLVNDAMVMVVGKGEPSGNNLKVIANDIYPIEKVKETFGKSVIFTINIDVAGEQTISQLRKIMERYRGGSCSCYFNLVGSTLSQKRVFYSKLYTVQPSEEFFTEVRQLPGIDGVKITG